MDIPANMRCSGSHLFFSWSGLRPLYSSNMLKTYILGDSVRPAKGYTDIYLTLRRILIDNFKKNLI